MTASILAGMMVKPVLWPLCCICLGFLPLQAQWTDHFDNICGLSDWSDIQVTEGWNIQAFEQVDISLSNPGMLTLMPYTVSWFADYRGPLLFKLASNDFVLTGKITVTNRQENAIPGPAYSLGGVMIRHPKSLTTGLQDWVPGQEDYVFLSIGNGAVNHPSCPGCPPPHFEVKSTDNSNSTLNLSPVTMNSAVIRMIRLHPYILVLYKYPGQSWIVHRRYARPDLGGTVQIGMVTYTDWDKVSTYSMPFHNSHVLNDALDPDPSTNPWLPFQPDIISTYEYMDFKTTMMPPAWIGLDLTNENLVSDQQILQYYGNTIAEPVAPTAPVWLGKVNQFWNNPDNWLPAEIPASNDTILVHSCACPAANCLEVPAGTTVISGMTVSPGGSLTVPAGDVLQVNGPFINHGTVIIYGQLVIDTFGGTAAINAGSLDCRSGGQVTILD